jgi:tetratricopeptide (TPR) repeat protein
VAAAQAAGQVFGYAEAAEHWERAIGLFPAIPGAAEIAGISLPQMFVRAIDALDAGGDRARAGAVAEEAYRQFAAAPDAATAALVRGRAACLRAMERPGDGLPLIKEALQLFETEPPSADQAAAWLHYANRFLFHAEGNIQASRAALGRGTGDRRGGWCHRPDTADHGGPGSLRVRVRAGREGFAILRRAQAAADAAGNEAGLITLAVNESAARLKTAQFERAADVARRGLRIARQAGRDKGIHAALLAANAAEALFAAGRAEEAALLVDPMTTGPPDLDHWPVHLRRAEIDLLRGDMDAAARRGRQISVFAGRIASIEHSREAARGAAELGLWAGRPGDALTEVRRVLAMYQEPGVGISFKCGRLLVTGMRACADLAEQALARRDERAADAAQAAADYLMAWLERTESAAFADHPFMATSPAERAAWDAERTRLAGASDPAAWDAAGELWEELDCRHQAAYARGLVKPAGLSSFVCKQGFGCLVVAGCCG